ncbi:MAG: hypothetical protein ABFR32_01230 [Bacteroidota bacterium]
MKNLKILVIAFTLFAMNVSAAVLTPVKPNTKLRAEIVELIGPSCPFEFDKNECTAEVLFTVNTNGEIIVLTVNSPNIKAEPFIKSKLNYKKVNFKPVKEGEVYLLPIRIVKES